MKTLLTIVLFLGVTPFGFTQDIKQNITDAFKSGNSKEISEFFTSSIDLAVNDNDDVYSKAQAEQILKKFFSEHKPSSFKIMHEGESRNGIKYFIGELETANGKFRVTINMKDVSGSTKIHQLRIE